MAETWSYNSLQQPISLGVTFNGGSPLLSLTWGYGASANSTFNAPADDNGNVTGQTIARTIPVAGGSPTTYSFSQSYGYSDPANRLLMANENGGWAQNYIYDAFGNRMLGTGSYAPNAGFTPTQGQSTAANQFPNNRWVRGQVLPCGTSGKMGDKYDCAGNQIQLATAVSPYNQTGSTFTYDGENRLLGANVANQGGAGFVYDGEGRRVEKITPSATTTYIHDAKGELAMEVSTAAPTASGTEYLTADTLGSTRLITDASGNPTRCLDYLPFGEEIPAGENGRTGPCYESLGSANTAQYPAAADLADQKFTGKERDAETGLDYFGARYFSAAQGRFTSPDAPFVDQHPGAPQSWNLYAYVRNNPLRAVDPDGHGSCLRPGQSGCPPDQNRAISMGRLGNLEEDAAVDQNNAAVNASSSGSSSSPSPTSPSPAAAVAGIVGPPFANQLARLLGEELSTMGGLGVTPLSPAAPGFASFAEQAAGQINWTLSTSGELLTAPALEGVTHAAIANGGNVLGAGTAQVATGGGQTVVFDITAQSGHYMNGASAAQSQAAIDAGTSAFSGFVTVLSDFVGVFVNPRLFPGFHNGCPPGGCEID